MAKYIGYTCEGVMSPHIQKRLICEYCVANNLILDELIEEIQVKETRSAKAQKDAARLGMNLKKWTKVYVKLEALMFEIMRGEVACVLVDYRERLYVSKQQMVVLNSLLKKMDVKVIEVGKEAHLPYQPDSVAVYHYVRDSKDIRPNIHNRDINHIYEVSKNFGNVSAVFYEKGTSRSLLSSVVEEDYKIVLIKNYYRVNRHSGFIIDLLIDFKEKGRRCIAVDDGELRVLNNTDKNRILGANLKAVAISNTGSEILFRRIQNFIHNKTCWDEDFITITKETFKSLDFKSYDIIVIDSITQIGGDISKVIHFLKSVKKPVFILSKGEVLVYEEI